jgi:spore cortex formation protein SpoVR/YcgB (stage V sporulation)
MPFFSNELKTWQTIIQAVARRNGLDFFPIIFDVLDWDTIAEVASYHGFPDHFSHWKFGEEYVKMRKSFSYGLSKIYEMVINTNPSIAYLLEENKLVDQKLVMAHVCAHVDFFKNNAWFNRSDRNMLATSRAASERIDGYRKEHEEQAVDDFLTDCMKIENLTEPRVPYAVKVRGKKNDRGEPSKKGEDLFRFRSDMPYLDDFLNPREWIRAQREALKDRQERASEIRKGLTFPAKPVRDILLFLLRFAPMEEWQRDILDILRQESYYFLPQKMTKIANEGWAAYWHSELMVKRGLAPPEEIVDYAQHNAGTLGSPGLNPYKLGLVIYRDIEYRWDTGRHGLLWEECSPFMDRKNQWDDFVVFKNIFEETRGVVAEKWTEWCSFKNGCEKGLSGFPRDLFSRDKIVKWWCEYEVCEETYAHIQDEIKVNTRKELVQEIARDLKWQQNLLAMKRAWKNGDLPRVSEPIPDVFFRLARKHPGKIELGIGREKIFEVRRRINDHALIHEFFTRDLFDRLPFFSYKQGGGGVPIDHWGVDKADFESIKRKLMLLLFNQGEPVIEIVDGRYGGPAERPHRGRGLYLKHRHEGADLRLDEMKDVLKVLFRMWQHPVYLETVVTEGERRSSVPPWVLHQMGLQTQEEKKMRRGDVSLFFTTDGETISEKYLREIEFPAPY